MGNRAKIEHDKLKKILQLLESKTRTRREILNLITEIREEALLFSKAKMYLTLSSCRVKMIYLYWTLGYSFDEANAKVKEEVPLRLE